MHDEYNSTIDEHTLIMAVPYGPYQSLMCLRTQYLQLESAHSKHCVLQLRRYGTNATHLQRAWQGCITGCTQNAGNVGRVEQEWGRG
jgi:hypothetical protein